MYKKILLSLFPFYLLANDIDFNEIKEQIIKSDKKNEVLKFVGDLENIKEQVLSKEIKKLNNNLDYKNEESKFLENMLKVNLDKVLTLISQKKYEEAFIIHSNLEYNDVNVKNRLTNFFKVVNDNDFEKLKQLDNKLVSFVLTYFFDNLKNKDYNISDINKLKSSILVLSENQLITDDKYRFFRDISILNGSFVDGYNYSYNIEDETYVDKEIKLSIKNILLLTEEVFLKYYLQTDKETILEINKKGL